MAADLAKLCHTVRLFPLLARCDGVIFLGKFLFDVFLSDINALLGNEGLEGAIDTGAADRSCVTFSLISSALPLLLRSHSCREVPCFSKLCIISRPTSWRMKST